MESCTELLAKAVKDGGRRVFSVNSFKVRFLHVSLSMNSFTPLFGVPSCLCAPEIVQIGPVHYALQFHSYRVVINEVGLGMKAVRCCAWWSIRVHHCSIFDTNHSLSDVQSKINVGGFWLVEFMIQADTDKFGLLQAPMNAAGTNVSRGVMGANRTTLPYEVCTPSSSECTPSSSECLRVLPSPQTWLLCVFSKC